MPFDGTRPDEANLLLLRAADLIEERGHAKHALEDSRGGLCILGALRMADAGTTDLTAPRSKGYHKAREKVSDKIGKGDLASWNNQPERTQQEVIDALRAATAQVI